jgi:hypothetical protein
MNELERFLLYYTNPAENNRIGNGIYRDVYRTIMKHLVIKIANCQKGQMENIMEMKLWEEVKDMPIKKWFAPCVKVSESGKYLLQEKIEHGRQQDYPEEVPHFFIDMKYTNYGWIGKQFVCCDYSDFIITNGFNSKKMKKAEWWEE